MLSLQRWPSGTESGRVQFAQDRFLQSRPCSARQDPSSAPLLPGGALALASACAAASAALRALRIGELLELLLGEVGLLRRLLRAACGCRPAAAPGARFCSASCCRCAARSGRSAPGGAFLPARARRLRRPSRRDRRAPARPWSGSAMRSCACCCGGPAIPAGAVRESVAAVRGFGAASARLRAAPQRAAASPPTAHSASTRSASTGEPAADTASARVHHRPSEHQPEQQHVQQQRTAANACAVSARVSITSSRPPAAGSSG